MAGRAVRLFFNSFFPCVDAMHRCRSRLRAVNSVRRHTLHVFGAGPWESLAASPNVVVHPAVSHGEALAIMAQSKVVINHAPTLADGAHERVWDALAAGCCVLSTPSGFLHEELGGSRAIRFFEPDQPDSLDEAIDAMLYGSDMPDAVETAQRDCLPRHTMKARAREIRRKIADHWPATFGLP